MLGKTLADSRPGLSRSLCASRFVVLLTLRNQLEEQQGLTLSLIRCDILENGCRFPILGDHNRALPLLGAGDELCGIALERCDRLDVFGSVPARVKATFWMPRFAAWRAWISCRSR
jgi:hypothetical protein